MKNIMKYMGTFVLVLSIFSNCTAKNAVQSITIQNDTGDDLYIALAKMGIGEGGSMILSEGKSDVRVVGKDGLVKAGSSVTIKNFPWTPKEEYLQNALWVAKSAAGLKATIASVEKKNYADFDKYIKLIVSMGYSSGASIGGGSVAMNSIDILKVRIVKTNGGEGEYTSEFIFPAEQKQAVVQDINMQNDTGDDLYMALVKTTGGTTQAATFLYKDKDNVHVLPANGLVKAGSSTTIKNFPWNSKESYIHVLWGAKSLHDLNAAIKDATKNNYTNHDSAIKLHAWVGNSSGLPGNVGIPMGDLLKVRIFKQQDGTYDSEFIWPAEQK